MPHPHIYTLYTHFCFGPGAKVESRFSAEGSRKERGIRGTRRGRPRKGPRKGYNVHRFMLEKKTRLTRSPALLPKPLLDKRNLVVKWVLWL